MVDSVFSPLLETPFPSDRPLIPVEEIEGALDAIEGRGVERQMALIESATEQILRDAEPFLTARNVEGILALNWNLQVALQRPIALLWAEGYYQGSEHAIEEMRAAVPPSQFGMRYATTAQVEALFSLEPQNLRNSPAEQAVLQRAIVLSGNFSGDTITALKGDLIAAIVPQSDTGQPITREQLLTRIQKTLSVSRNRAEIIARTELTSAYNLGRLTTYNESEMVTHVKFLAIRDARTTEICRTRNGLIIAKGSVEMVFNTPPLHARCRSVLSPVMPSVNPSHQKWVDDPDRQLENRKLTPLPKGWRTNELPKPEPTPPPPPKPEPKPPRKRKPKPRPDPAPEPTPPPPPKPEPTPPPSPEPEPTPKKRKPKTDPVVDKPAPTPKLLPIPDNLKPHEKIIRHGQNFAPDRIAKIDKLLEEGSDELKRIQAEIEPLKAKVAKAINADAVPEFLDSPEGKQFMRLQQAEAMERSRIEDLMFDDMKAIRQSLFDKGLSETEAKALASRIEIDPDALQEQSEESLRSIMTDFFRVTNGKGGASLKELVLSDDRAWARQNGLITIGRNEGDSTRVLWHEMGHHIEFEDLRFANAAEEWVKSRSTSPSMMALSDLIPGAGYDWDELAYPDAFVSPYVGKIYYLPGNEILTEVLSMGIERFHNTREMVKFYRSDKEHFLFILGVLDNAAL